MSRGTACVRSILLRAFWRASLRVIPLELGVLPLRFAVLRVQRFREVLARLAVLLRFQVGCGVLLLAAIMRRALVLREGAVPLALIRCARVPLSTRDSAFALPF